MKAARAPNTARVTRHCLDAAWKAASRSTHRQAAPLALTAAGPSRLAHPAPRPALLTSQRPVSTLLQSGFASSNTAAAVRGVATWSSLWPFRVTDNSSPAAASTEASSSAATFETYQQAASTEASSSATTLETYQQAAESAAPAAESAAETATANADTWMTQLVSPLVPYVDALPSLLHLPEDMPYRFTVSIVLATILLRSTITLPIMIWHRRRMRRMTEIVVPAFARLKQTLPEIVAKRSRRQRLSYDDYEKDLQRELKSQLKVLTKENRCAPLPTIILPVAVSLPLLIVMTMTLRVALQDPATALTSETIPWWSPPADLKAQFEASARMLADRGIEGEALAKLSVIQGPTLAETDKSMIGPISVGMLNMINTELGQWLRRGMISESTVEEQHADKERLRRGEDPDDDKRGKRVSASAIRASHAAEKRSTAPAAQSQTRAPAPATDQVDLSPIKSSIIGNVLRAAAIGFVVVASQAPAALVIYWISSASYTCVQSTAFAITDHRRSVKKKSLPSLSGTSLPLGAKS